MRNIFIEECFFHPGSKKSEGLISGMISLKNKGYVICFNKAVAQKYPWLTAVLKFEKIKYKTVTGVKGMPVIGKEYKNLTEGIRSVTAGRKAKLERKTKETEITVALNLDGTGESRIETGIGFFDHMLDQIARHANIQLEVKCKGDLNVDEHHSVEDTGLLLGEAIKEALGDKKGIQRYGFFVPMDEAASVCTIDLSGRSFLNYECDFKRNYVGTFPVELVEEFFKSVASGLKAAIYIRAKGKNDHHKIESVFKAFAKSLNEACRFDERNNNRLPSTKGVL